MKVPNTKLGFPKGEPTSDWTAEQFLAYVKNQYKQLTAPDGEIRKAVGATNADLEEMRNTIDNLEKVTALNTQRSYDELDAVSTPEELIIYLAKQAAKQAAASPGKARKKPTPREAAKMKEIITDPETADKVIKALDLMQGQALDRIADILDKSGRKGVYLPPSDILGKKRN